MSLVEKLDELVRLTEQLASPTIAAKMDNDGRSTLKLMKRQLIGLKDQMDVMEKVIDGQLDHCRGELAKIEAHQEPPAVGPTSGDGPVLDQFSMSKDL